MPRYRLSCSAAVVEWYIIEADNEDDAIEKYHNGEYEFEGSETYDSEIENIQELTPLRHEDPNNVEYHLSRQ